AFGQHHEPLGGVGSLDDLNVDLREDAGERITKLGPLISAVGIEFHQEREQSKQGCHQHGAAVPILDIGGVYDRLQYQPLCIDQDVPLLALDLLAGVKGVRINAVPPFSALFTLWLSITAAVGLASRFICSRHFT